jgi:predicted neutral ceramidase superfamily lipid hydrolase
MHSAASVFPFNPSVSGATMLLQLVAHHPEALVPVVRNTPIWVWGLLASLLALGISQLRDRTASLARVSLLPVVMTIVSVSGTFSALSGTPHRAMAILVWLVAAALAFALLAHGRSAAQYDAALRVYRLPGSVVPLLLIVGIFLVKYVVGVDLAMAPQLVRDTPYVLTIAALYGAFTGVFVGRASRLWRLSLRPAAAAGAAA